MKRLALLLAASGCAFAPEARDGRGVSIDTLPGGIVRVTNHSPADSGRWSLVLERTVQPPDDSAGALRDPDELLLLDDGSLLVADRKPMELVRFDGDGRFLGVISRDGEGRGEHRAARLAARGDTLVVHDPRLGRTTTRLLSTGSIVSERVQMPTMWGPIGVDGRGLAVIPMVPHRDSVGPSWLSVVRSPLGGDRVDTVTVPIRSGTKQSWAVRAGGEVVLAAPVPLQPYDLITVEPTAGLLIGWGGEYTLRTTRDGRDTTRLFSRPQPRGSEVSEAEKRAIIDREIVESKKYLPTLPEAAFREGFPAARIPDQRPSFVQLAVDGRGRRWVMLSATDSSVVQFDLFDRDGRWLDIVSIPQSGWSDKLFRPASWAADRVAVIVMDADGRPAIKVYRILRG